MENISDSHSGEGVILGFLEPRETGFQETEFPEKIDGKVGGLPSWLDLKHIPNRSQLSCPKCKRSLAFLIQIYAPLKDQHSFHRILYLFGCKNGKCHKESPEFKVLRCQLPKENPFYEENERGEYFRKSNAPKSKTCSVCGLFADKHCGKCKRTNYCEKDHQIEDWNAGHNVDCKNFLNGSKTDYVRLNLPSIINKEFELVTEAEELDSTEDQSLSEDIEKSIKKMQKVALKDNEKLEEDMEEMTHDKTFLHFQKTIKPYPDQVLRYYEGENAVPLWISAKGTIETENIPPCPFCKSKRRLEFQILPQLLYQLKLDRIDQDTLDFGVLNVYTCEKSCQTESPYAEEYVWKQDISPEEREQQLNQREEEEEEVGDE